MAWVGPAAAALDWKTCSGTGGRGRKKDQKETSFFRKAGKCGGEKDREGGRTNSKQDATSAVPKTYLLPLSHSTRYQSDIRGGESIAQDQTSGYVSGLHEMTAFPPPEESLPTRAFYEITCLLRSKCFGESGVFERSPDGES